MKINLILISFIFLICMIGSASAWEWDNQKTYNETTRTITFWNSFLGFRTNQIATAQLKSEPHLWVDVKPGTSSYVVGEIDVQLFDAEYDNFFKDLNFYDMKLNNTPSNDNFVLKQKIFDHNETLPNYIYVCEDNNIAEDNETKSQICNKIQNGTFESPVYDWIDANFTGISKGNFTFGIWTDVTLTEHKEWQPTLFGVLVNDWADFIGATRIAYNHPQNLQSSSSYSNQLNAITFTMNTTLDGWRLVGISAHLGSNGNGTTGDLISPFNMTIWTTDATGIPLAPTSGKNDTINQSLVSLDENIGDWINITMSATVLDNDTRYALVLGENYTLGVTSQIFWLYDPSLLNGNVVPFEGRRLISDNGIWQPPEDKINGFEIWATPTDAAPEITLNFPANNTGYIGDPTSIVFNWSVQDDFNITNSSLFINGVLNQTQLGGDNISEAEFNVTGFTSGAYLWHVEAWDNFTQKSTSESRTAFVDNSAPNVTIVFPKNGTEILTGSLPYNLNFKWTISHISGFSNCWYYNETANVTVTCGDNATIQMENGTHTLIAYANSTNGFLGQDLTMFTITGIIINNVTFNSSVYETDYEYFDINFTANPDFISASGNLIYNGTKYLGITNCIGLECIIHRNIDIPKIVNNIDLQENRTFFWNVTIFNGNTTLDFNTEFQNKTQSVNRIYLQECGGIVTTQGLNFTAWDEGNLTRISPYRFAGTFFYWLGTGTQYKNYSVGNLSIIEKNICINPADRTFKHTTQIEYGFSNENISYNTRNYYFQNASITNQSQDIYLYLLNALDSTTFIQELLDQNLIGIPNALIYMLRYYPENNTFNTVQISKTDDNGKTVGFYKTETVDYKHIIVLNGTVIFTDNQRKIFVEELPARIKFILGDNTTSPWKQFEGRDNLVENLSYDPLLHMIAFTYIDTSGSFSSARLIVTLDNYNNSATEICNTQSNQAAGIIQCNITGQLGTFTAKGYIGRSPETLADLIVIIVKTALDNLGLLLGLFIIIGAYLASLYDLNIGLVTGQIVTILVNVTPLTHIPPLFIFAQIALTIMALVVINKQ